MAFRGTICLLQNISIVHCFRETVTVKVLLSTTGVHGIIMSDSRVLSNPESIKKTYEAFSSFH